MKRVLTLLLGLAAVISLQAQGIDDALLSEISKGYSASPGDKALRNALSVAPINTLASNADKASLDLNFSDKVKTKGHTDQKSSGRCWLFCGLNVLRAQMIEKYDLGAFTFSQNYLFFYDQLEKSNLFLQAVIDTRDLPFDDRTVDWLFAHPIGDGGTFTGVANLVMKYGVVPSEVMKESYAANSTSQMRAQLSLKLREDGLRLRQEAEKAGLDKLKGKKLEKAKVDLEARLAAMKKEQLKDIYHILALTLGVPPKEFNWNRYDSKGKLVSSGIYTPKSFYKEFLGEDLESGYVMLMNDPCHDYYKVYEIEYDRHVYDGQNWVYLNLPMEDIKQMAIASIKAGKAMYFSCDVGKFLDRKAGIADLANFDYESLLGVSFGMDKKERVLTHASGSSHAMTLIAVDLKDGKPVKWMVENSWGEASGYKGNIVMTDEWFDEYMFRLVVEKGFVPASHQGYLSQKPILLPAWDPMFAPEE